MPVVQLTLVDAAAARLVPSVAMVAIGASIAHSAREIGKVSHVKVWAQGTAPQDLRGPPYRADEVVADETVKTIEDGALHIRFIDDTRLRLGSVSRATHHTFVFDPRQRAR